MAEARFRLLGWGGGASLENYLNFSECLKNFQIKLAEKTNVSLMPVPCSVPWFPLTSSASPVLPTCTDQIWPFLSSPSPILPPMPSSLTGWPLTGLPARVIDLLDPLPTELPGHALCSRNHITSAKLPATSPLCQLMICNCHMRFF